MEKASQRFIRLDEVMRLTALSETSIYRQMKAGVFPQNISISANAKAWLESEVQQWINGKINQRTHKANYGSSNTGI